MDRVLMHLIHLNRHQKTSLIRLPRPIADQEADPQADQEAGQETGQETGQADSAPRLPQESALAVTPSETQHQAPRDAQVIGTGEGSAAAPAPKAIQVPKALDEPPGKEPRKSGLWPFSR